MLPDVPHQFDRKPNKLGLGGVYAVARQGTPCRSGRRLWPVSGDPLHGRPRAAPGEVVTRLVCLAHDRFKAEIPSEAVSDLEASACCSGVDGIHLLERG